MNNQPRRSAEISGRSSKGFLFLILLGMFFVLFVLPQLKNKTRPGPAGPDAPGQVGLPGPLGAPQKGGTGTQPDWNLEDVDIRPSSPHTPSAPGKISIKLPENFGKGGTIELPDTLVLPDGRTPGFNPTPGPDTPPPPKKTEKGDWIIEEVETTPASGGREGAVKPIERTRPGKSTTQGDWNIETK